MFERKKSPPPQKRIDSLIGAGTTVHGDIQFTGGLRIDGTVDGKVSTVDNQPGTLVISEKARVHGDVQYRSLEMHAGAIVQGKLAHAEPETASIVELKRASGE